jgi:hypothetical protein
MINGMRVNLEGEFIEECLGTCSNNPEIQEEYVAGLAPDAQSREEEVAAVGVGEVVEKGKTVFPRDEEGRVVMWNYMVKGFLKAACGALVRVPGTLAHENKAAWNKVLTDLVFVEPRRIVLELPEGRVIGNLQRPLRGQTAQGERIALANSETVPAGTKFRFTVLMLDKRLWPRVEELLKYGELKGLGQWRNSGKGSFVCRVVE